MGLLGLVTLTGMEKIWYLEYGERIKLNVKGGQGDGSGSEGLARQA